MTRMTSLCSMDVSDLKTAQEIAERSLASLEKRKDELVRANAELEQFVYIASHDLQEPVRTVRNFVNLLSAKYGNELDDTGRQALDYLGGASDRMRDLIRSLLDFSRLGLDGAVEDVDLGLLFDAVLSDLASRVSQSGAKITHSELPVVPGHPAELRSLFQNLISNAIKFGKPGVPPEISIEANEADDAWQFQIRDNGVGIDPRYHGRIFEIFQQVEPDRADGGTGIGLAHCKKIVEIHGGRIWVHSEVGQGATFRFSLPKRIESVGLSLNKVRELASPTFANK